MTTALFTLYSLGLDASELSMRGNGDPWGTAIIALGDIAHAMEHYGTRYAPAHWEYRDGMGCNGLQSSADARRNGEDREARNVAAAILRGRGDEIERAGNVLDRYLRHLVRAERDY